MILRQSAERPIRVGERRPRFGLFLVEVGRDVGNPNSLELRPFDDLDDAKRAAVGWWEWTGPSPPRRFRATALLGIANVIRDPAVLPKYAPWRARLEPDSRDAPVALRVRRAVAHTARRLADLAVRGRTGPAREKARK